MKKIVLFAGLLAFVCVPVAVEAAPMKKPASCKVVAKRAADNAGNGRILTTALFGGMSGLVIGGMLSNNNPKGEKRAGGLFGGGLIGGKGYKVQWQRDYNKAYAKCVG
jgi:ribulose 1,5-bisphosphate synthetase/thiazole synthase